jgi:hypothetical protein
MAKASHLIILLGAVLLSVAATHPPSAQGTDPKAALAEMTFRMTVAQDPTCIDRIKPFAGKFEYRDGAISLVITDGMPAVGVTMNLPGKGWNLKYGADGCRMRVYIGTDEFETQPK